MQFRFKDKENPLQLVSNVVHSMLIYPLTEVLSANYLLTEWKPELIGKVFFYDFRFNPYNISFYVTDELVLQKLDPKEARVTVVGQKTKDKCILEERWYKTKYYFEKIEQSAIDVS